ncbi:hypothetical protein C0J52_25009 [Blattella germanica]|nr:hypothetical protein C0J52_25009 [Blattella germanica]
MKKTAIHAQVLGQLQNALQHKITRHGINIHLARSRLSSDEDSILHQTTTIRSVFYTTIYPEISEMSKRKIFDMRKEEHVAEVIHIIQSDCESESGNEETDVLSENEEDNEIEAIEEAADEIENSDTDEEDVNVVSEDENYISKNGMSWSKNPPKATRRTVHNIVGVPPGLTGASNRIQTVNDAFKIFFDDTILKMIVDCTNKKAQTYYEDWNRRLQHPMGLHKPIVAAMRNLVPEPEPLGREDDDPPNTKLSKRSRCQLCPRKTDRKGSVSCEICKKCTVTEMSRNLRCDLKEDIQEAISELRTSLSNLWNVMEEKERLINALTEATNKAETAGAFVARNGDGNERNRRPTPSVDGGLNFSAVVRSSKHGSVRFGEISVGGRTNYGTAVRDSSTTYERNYKLMIKSKLNESTEAMKTLLKRKINPTQLKVGISSIREGFKRRQNNNRIRKERGH